MNTNFLNSVTNFLKKRSFELAGLILISIGILLSISFFTYSPSDPTLIYGDKENIINNILGVYGGLISDFLLQSFGLISFLLLATFFSWGYILIIKKELRSIIFKLLFVSLYLIFGCTFIYVNFDNSFWLVDNGNSGFVGKLIYELINQFFPQINDGYSNYILLLFTIVFFYYCLGN